MEIVKSKPNLDNVKKISANGNEDDLEENKENIAPLNDQFDDQNIKNKNMYSKCDSSPAHQQLIHSSRKSITPILYKKHSNTVEGIETELTGIKHYATAIWLDELENTLKIDLRTRPIAKSEYIYEHIESDSKVFKPRSLFTNILDSSFNSNSINNIENKPKEIENDDCIQVQNNQHLNFNILPKAIKTVKLQEIKVLNSHDGDKFVKNRGLGHGGIKVPEKQLHTVPKPFSFESRKSCAFKNQDMKSTEQSWMFKATPATVLTKKPFVPKYEKKYTPIPKNICLNTEKRAQEWIVFKQAIKEKIAYFEQMSQRKQEENAKEEMKLIRKMRQQTIHKPEPIKKYKPILIKKSTRPVTIPHSPRFSIRPVRSGLKSIST